MAYSRQNIRVTSQQGQSVNLKDSNDIKTTLLSESLNITYEPLDLRDLRKRNSFSSKYVLEPVCSSESRLLLVGHLQYPFPTKVR